MTIPVPIIASFIAATAAILIAVVGALFNINSRLGKLEQGQEMLAGEIRTSRERSDMQHAAAMQLADARHSATMELFDARHSAMVGLVDARLSATMELVDARLSATMELVDARLAAAEERALARHNELLAEIRLWRSHGHDADGTIFFRVPEPGS